jgi:hypothetical protein
MKAFLPGAGLGRHIGALAAALFTFASTMAAAGDFRTSDPLKAFVHEQYALGSDYFIKGKDDTVLFRCLLSKPQHSFEGIALSELSIWGNRGGEWEIFRRESDGSFVYVGTRRIEDTACLESCKSREYVSTGRCTWQRGWPKP